MATWKVTIEGMEHSSGDISSTETLTMETVHQNVKQLQKVFNEQLTPFRDAERERFVLVGIQSLISVFE